MVAINEMNCPKSSSERASSFLSAVIIPRLEDSQSRSRNIMQMSAPWGARSLTQYQQRDSCHVSGLKCGRIKRPRRDKKVRWGEGDNGSTLNRIPALLGDGMLRRPAEQERLAADAKPAGISWTAWESKQRENKAGRMKLKLVLVNKKGVQGIKCDRFNSSHATEHNTHLAHDAKSILSSSSWTSTASPTFFREERQKGTISLSSQWNKSCSGSWWMELKL